MNRCTCICLTIFLWIVSPFSYFNHSLYGWNIVDTEKTLLNQSNFESFTRKYISWFSMILHTIHPCFQCMVYHTLLLFQALTVSCCHRSTHCHSTIMRFFFYFITELKINEYKSIIRLVLFFQKINFNFS